MAKHRIWHEIWRWSNNDSRDSNAMPFIDVSLINTKHNNWYHGWAYYGILSMSNRKHVEMCSICLPTVAFRHDESLYEAIQIQFLNISVIQTYLSHCRQSSISTYQAKSFKLVNEIHRDTNTCEPMRCTLQIIYQLFQPAISNDSYPALLEWYCMDANNSDAFY